MRKKYFFIMIGMFSFLLSSCGNKDNDINIALTHYAYQETENGKWGIMTPEGKIVVKPTFQGMPTPVTDGCFWVPKQDGTYELRHINNPETIVDDRYTDITGFNEGKALVTKIGEKNIICIDKNGNKLFELPNEIKVARPFQDEMAVIMKLDDSIGYINQDGNIVIPCQYHAAQSFDDGYAMVFSINRKFLETYNDEDFGGNCSIIDKDGKHITDITIDNSFETVSTMLKSITNNPLGFFSFRKNITHYIENGGYGLKTFEENIIVPANTKYKFIGGFLGNYCIFQTENGYGIMDKKGKIVVQDKYDQISMIRKNELFVACQKDKWGILTIDEKQLCPFSFDHISSTPGQYFLGINKVEDNLIYSLITKTGEIKKNISTN